jgi:hypothetical protein
MSREVWCSLKKVIRSGEYLGEFATKGKDIL